MKSKETKLANKFRALLKERGCLDEKLHGNQFQAGLPDLMLGRPDGIIWLIETKQTMRISLTYGEVIGMLRPEQRRFFIQWREYPVYVLVFSGVGLGLIHAADLFDSRHVSRPVEWDAVEDIVDIVSGV